MISLNTPKEILTEIAVLLKEHRLKLNLTQKELADRANISLSTLRKFERTGKIALESFLKMAFVLDVAGNILDALKNNNQEFRSMDELLKANKKTVKKRASKHAK